METDKRLRKSFERFRSRLMRILERIELILPERWTASGRYRSQERRKNAEIVASDRIRLLSLRLENYQFSPDKVLASIIEIRRECGEIPTVAAGDDDQFPYWHLIDNFIGEFAGKPRHAPLLCQMLAWPELVMPWYAATGIINALRRMPPHALVEYAPDLSRHAKLCYTTYAKYPRTRLAEQLSVAYDEVSDILREIAN